MRGGGGGEAMVGDEVRVGEGVYKECWVLLY